MVKHLTTALAVALLAGGAAAQQPPKPKPTPQPAAKPAMQARQYAVFGTIKALDLKANKLVVTPMKGADLTFMVDPRTTHIRGLEGPATLSALAAKTGAGIVVEYIGPEPEMKAFGIAFIGTEPVKLVEGTLVRVDKPNRSVVIKTTTGTEETFHLLVGAPIELATGFVDLNLFASKLNEPVSLYYTERAGAKQVHLIKTPQQPVS